MNAKHSMNHGQCNAGNGLESRPDVIQKSSKTESPDFSIEGEGRFCTVYLLRPLTPAAFEWIEEHIPEDAQRLGSAVAVEHRFVAGVVEGIQNDGLVAVQS
jgi:predicted thioesterase